MREIVPKLFWLGNSQAATIENILANEIAAVVDLAMEEKSPSIPRNTLYYRFPIIDGQQTTEHFLKLAIQSLAALPDRKISTLIFCRAGMSRSPSVAAAALTLVQGGTLEDHLQQVVAGHPHDISPAFWKDVKTVVSEIESC